MNAVTGWVLLGVTILLIAYDIWRIIKKDDSTISAFLYHAAQKYPLIPFLFGLLMGHFFFPQFN